MLALLTMNQNIRFPTAELNHALCEAFHIIIIIYVTPASLCNEAKTLSELFTLSTRLCDVEVCDGAYQSAPAKVQKFSVEPASDILLPPL